MDTVSEARLLDKFLPLLSEDKRRKMSEVIELRTDRIRVVLDNVFQPHNASAVMRSCECFGIQNLHVVESNYAYRPNADIALGASKWINIHRYKKAAEAARSECLADLKAKGFKIVATALSQDAVPLPLLDIQEPLALVFGTEKVGLSSEWLDSADHLVQIPMFGFTQSFNVSVSAALCLYDLTLRLRKSSVKWQLSPDEKRRTLLRWAKNSLRNPDIIERSFLAQNKE